MSRDSGAPVPAKTQRRCHGITLALRRCKRQGGWLWYCPVHERQPLRLAFVLVFTVLAGIASIYSALKPPSHPVAQLSLPLVRAMTPTSATLTGTVDTGTPPMRAWFEYDKNYDSLAAADGIVMPQVAGSPFIREGTYPIEQYITGLSPNTTYYYRLVVSNDYKAYEAQNIRQFTTPSDSAPVH